METLRELFEDQLKDLYSAEQQLVKALPRMAKKASSETLRQGINDHLKQTEEQAQRLERIASELEFKISGKKCKAMEGLIAEGKEVLEEDGDDAVLDAALIAAAQRVEHYEIAAYGTAVAIADQLGLKEASKILQETLAEEKEADEHLTDICTSEIFASMSQEEDEDETDDSDVEVSPARPGSKPSKRDSDRTRNLKNM